jgi:Flp pilus assembly protein TadB
VVTTPGYVLMGVWITLNVLGYLTIRRILDIDI